ncbi:MAG: hypothetical protein ACXVNF_14260 [Neobacillus sp.]
MPRENVKVKSVHFNTNKPDDALMLKSIGRKNFSRYVKKLIKEDISRKAEEPKQTVIKQTGGIHFELD